MIIVIRGEYAKYRTLALKRQLSRDGQSLYVLNGTRCRRKDIVDIFLGTGLDPRSYAVIEQGTISRLIEAKSGEMLRLLKKLPVSLSTRNVVTRLRFACVIRVKIWSG